jgi:uncharacterized protein (DUF433 family)
MEAAKQGQAREVLMDTVIINRGRGPEIAGTRITVYDILDYSTRGHHPTYIAAILDVSSDEVLAALKYIEEHQEEVMAEYQKILDRIARGNPPEIEARAAASRARLLARKAELQQARNKEVNSEGPSGGH